MSDYSVAEAFQQIEDYLIDSMIRNLSHHVGLEQAEGINYTQWQAEQLAALAEYRRTNAEKFTEYFSKINARITVALNRAAQLGETEQEQAILKALKSGWKRPRPAKYYGTDSLSGAFFRVNDRKLNAYIAAVKRDMKKAETALLRMADDQYRKAIFNAGVAYNTGIYTLPQAIDSATNDMLSRGLNCIEYKNGARVCIDTYAEMALRTSATRCYLQGESRKRDEWGVNTVIVNKRGIACPRCLKYVGRVFYDDVYGSVPVPDDKYPRLSEAIAGGLYHPNCKDIHTTWFEGISTPPAEMSDADKKKAEENYKLEQRQRYNERQIRKYKRLSAGTLDPDEKQRYTKRLVQWENYNANFIEQHGDVLRQRAEREKIRDWNFSVPKPPIKARKGVDKSAGSGIMEREREFGVQYGPISIKADVEFIFSREYTNLFSNITNNQVVNDSIADLSRKAILHRNGSKYEDMYIVNANTGEVMGQQLDMQYPSGISYNDSIKSALSRAKEENIPIIAIHNHPEGYPPSIDDFNKAYDNNYILGIACGHNGQVYVYDKPEFHISQTDADEIHAAMNLLIDQGADPDRIYREYYNELGLSYRIEKGGGDNGSS